MSEEQYVPAPPLAWFPASEDEGIEIGWNDAGETEVYIGVDGDAGCCSMSPDQVRKLATALLALVEGR